jgi:hypothetical protein
MSINVVSDHDPHDPHPSRAPLTLAQARDLSRELSKRIKATDNRFDKIAYVNQFHRRCAAHRNALTSDTHCKALIDAYALHIEGKL